MDETAEHARASDEADRLSHEATLEAVGAGRPQNWDRAFQSLLQAAQQNSPLALAQLALLQTESPTNEGTHPNIEHLLQSPAAVRLCEAPRIRSIAGFASLGECAWLRTRGELKPARVFDPASGKSFRDARRNNSSAELELSHLDVVTQVIRARIARATRLPLPVFEQPQVMRYLPGQEFKAHFDYLDQRTAASEGQRIATFLIYLNDDYEGGETEFPRIDLTHRGKTGDALFFANVDHAGRADPLTLHSGNAPIRSEKWIFSQWIRDRSFTPKSDDAGY